VHDLASQQMPVMRDEYLVQGGAYRCLSCRPPRSYPADGKLHEVSGDPEARAESVTIAGPRRIVTRIEGPALVRETTMTVAPDGRTAAYVSLDHRPGVAGTLRTEYLARRVAKGPAGAHPVSGVWLGVRYVAVPVEVRTIILADAGGTFSYRAPFVGVSFTAKVDGPPVPVQGPYGGKITAAIRRLSPTAVEEDRWSDGKLVLKRTYALGPDGRSLEIAATDVAAGTTFRSTAHRKAP
jgi:hypothetical protein